MTILSWILISIGALMYLEGVLCAGIIGLILKPSKLLWPLLLLLWPIAIPVLVCRAYAKYNPIIQEIQQNPFLGAMLGLGQPKQSPVAAILGNQPGTGAPAFNPLELLAQIPQPQIPQSQLIPIPTTSVPVPLPAPTQPKTPEESETETSKTDENNKGDQTQ